MKRVVMFSGGAASWATARRVADTFGTADMTLLFTDTMSEDEDLYRFLDEAAADIDAPFIRLADGRDIWQVFKDERYLGNSRKANEEDVRQHIGADVSILRDRRGGESETFTLRALREEVEAGVAQPLWDIGGCACFEEPA